LTVYNQLTGALRAQYSIN